jgi:hypothetical protein
MNISTSPAGQAPPELVDTPNAPAKQASNPPVTPEAPAVPAANAASADQVSDDATSAKPAEPLTDVSLRLDNNGRIYYVVSDPTSGQEILEVPPKALRDVDQGIADYLKQQQSKVSSHVKVSA